MQSVDLNLLAVLDALLQEGSVSEAARRLHLTPPAVSRSLNRLRKITGDPLFVRAGRNLVPTPLADELRDRAHDVLASALDLLSPADAPPDDVLEPKLDRTFVVSTGPDNCVAFGSALLHEVRRRAPGARVHFAGEDDRASVRLRDGDLDLVLGSSVHESAEGIHRESLLCDEVVIVGRREGALARSSERGSLDLEAVARYGYVNRLPESAWHATFDGHLHRHGLRRSVVTTAPGFEAAFDLARGADLLCLAPDRLTFAMRGADLRTWRSPIPLRPLQIEQAWHSRNHRDPTHVWFRARVRAAVKAVERAASPADAEASTPVVENGASTGRSV